MENVKRMSKNGAKVMKIDIVNFLQKIQNAKENFLVFWVEFKFLSGVWDKKIIL